MKNRIAWSAALLATAAAVATPVFAQDYRGAHRDHDRRAYDHRGDRDRHDDRDGRWAHDDRRDGRWGDRHDDRYDRRDRRYDERHRYDERRAYAPHVYRPPYAYVVPRGYAVERWRVGYRMPPPFYASRYYVDPYAYQLRLPPRGYRWVRVDRDAYMVSLASGVIADVLYGIFR